MLSEFTGGPKVVGAKQTKRVLAEGRALAVFVAENADPCVTEPIETLCRTAGVSVHRIASMKELGTACGIAVGAAVAALVR